MLGNISYPMPPIVVLRIFAKYLYAPPLSCQFPKQKLNQGTFTSPIGAYKGNEIARVYGKVNPFKNQVIIVGKVYIFNFNNLFHNPPSNLMTYCKALFIAAKFFLMTEK